MSENFLYGNGTNRLYGVSDNINLDSSETVATSKAVYELNKKIEATGKLPLGHFFLHPFPTPPDGCLVVNGGEYNRDLYKDLWADVQIKGQYKTEAEWQQIASANGGYCPWYSNGDGSTTFRTPKFAPYQKLALASGDAGKYYEAGLPDHDHTIITYGDMVDGGGQWAQRWTNTRASKTGKASASNSIYGNSTTVRPESNDWIVCVVAFGTATNVGSVDVANVMSAVSQVQAEVSTKLEDSTVHIVETWKSGQSWYRKYSDGFIEQGGFISIGSPSEVTTTFFVPFTIPPTYLPRWCNQ